MKKLILLFMLSALTLTLIGCSFGTEPPGTEPPVVNVHQEVTPPYVELTWGDDITVVTWVLDSDTIGYNFRVEIEHIKYIYMWNNGYLELMFNPSYYNYMPRGRVFIRVRSLTFD